MKEKILNERAVIGVAIVVAVAASLVYFSTMKPRESAKDPATIALNLDDMSPGASIIGKKYVDLSDAEKIAPDLPWQEWGFEIRYDIAFWDNGEVLCEVFRFLTSEGAHSACESLYLSLDVQEIRDVSIGDGGKLYQGARFPNSRYVVFRKANFIAILGVKPGSEDRVLEYSRIVENRIES